MSIDGRMGVVSLVGDAGTGKTMVLECLRSALGTDTPCAFLSDSRITFGRFLETIASDLNLDVRSEAKSGPQVFLALTRLVAKKAESSRTVVLILDEAQDLPADLFNEILHIASLQQDKAKAIQIVFAGRPEVYLRLAALNPDTLNQRAMLSRCLYPFTAEETGEYIAFRMACAGMPNQTVFPRKVLEDIHDRSQGFAPAIHALCDRLLRNAFWAKSTVCTQKLGDQVLKKPGRGLSLLMQDAPFAVAAGRIRRALRAPLSTPEAPPMQTALLRVPVEARLGSLCPRPLNTDELPGDLTMITPRVRFELVRVELAPSPIYSMLDGACIKASVGSRAMRLGPVISPLTVTGFSPRLPKGAVSQPSPPMQTELLRVTADARLGSLRPRPVRARILRAHLAAIKLPVAFPRGRFELAGAAPRSATIHPMPPEVCTKPSVLNASTRLGSSILPVAIAAASPLLPKTAVTLASPAMQTLMLRVSVEARPGSRCPQAAATDACPAALAQIRLPGERFELLGATPRRGPIHPMDPETYTKAAVLSPSMGGGTAIFPVAIAELSPILSKATLGAAHMPGVPHFPAASLIPAGRYLGPALTGPPAFVGTFAQLISHDLQPLGVRASLLPASVIPWSRVALAPLRASDRAPLSSSTGRFVGPEHSIPVEWPTVPVLSASRHPSVAISNAPLPLPPSGQPVAPTLETLIISLANAEPSLEVQRPKLRLKPADPSRPWYLAPLKWIPQIAKTEIPWAKLADTLQETRKRLPSGRKPLVAFVIPVLAALAFYTAPPAMHAAANVSRQQWGRAQQAVLNRAAVVLDEEFKAGLSQWTNRGGSTPTWRSDASGFVRPDAPALYRPSHGMADYEMQFLGTIHKKDLSWIVRAADFDNYYAIRLTVLKPGPLPTIGITRYAVIHGIPQKRVTTPLLMRAQADTVYRVRLDVQGDHFTLSIQDQPVDSWSEPGLRQGGIGFFSDKDAGSSIASLHVRGQSDMLGRLCAFLVPASLSNNR